jgi:hypothetical protein
MKLPNDYFSYSHHAAQLYKESSGPVMNIKAELTKQIEGGKKVIEFESGAQSVNVLIGKINSTLKELGYYDHYALSIKNSTVRVELK